MSRDKSDALCAQVRRALDVALAAECRDAALIDLIVLEVWPDPTPRRLRVWVQGPAGMNAEDRERVLRRLAAAKGFLRSQVAEAIHRKRTPELAFELIGGAVPPRGELR
jgi:ribosome-binding factor A